MNSKNHPAYWEAEWIIQNRKHGYYRDCVHESQVIQQIVGRRSLSTARILNNKVTLKLGDYDSNLVRMVAGNAYHENEKTESSHGKRLAEVVITCPNITSRMTVSDVIGKYNKYRDQVIDDIVEETHHIEKAKLGMFNDPLQNDLLKTVFNEFEVDDHWKRVYYSQEDKLASMLIMTGVYKEHFCIELYFHL